ncbi:hypothetical protein M3914_003150 [Vibrio metschnikovii]|nr:hypothetical protein [Vibrio metschnikovii]
MDIYNKILSTVLACAVTALGAGVYVGTMGPDFKLHSILLSLASSVLVVITTGLILLFSKLREKKLNQNVSSTISKFADEIDKQINKSK